MPQALDSNQPSLAAPDDEPTSSQTASFLETQPEEAHAGELPPGRLSFIRRQLRGYLRSLGWVVRDAGRVHWRRALSIVVFNLIGVGAGTASIGGVILLVRAAGDGAP